MVIAFPFVWLSNTLSKSISSKEDKVSREEIAAMAEMGEDEGSIDEQESDIIENLFRLKEIQIEDILTPRSVIYAFEDTQTVGKIMDSTEDIIFSRIPVRSWPAQDCLCQRLGQMTSALDVLYARHCKVKQVGERSVFRTVVVPLNLRADLGDVSGLVQELI